MGARRKKEKHRMMGRIARGVVVIILIGAGLAGMGWAVMQLKHRVAQSDLWRVRFVQWPPGFPQDTQEQFNTALIGRNLFTIDLKDLERTLRRKHPQWQGLRVQRVPPHGLLVMGRQRKPLMILRTKNDSWLLDDQGWIIGHAPVQNDVPVVDVSRLSLTMRRPRVGFALRHPHIVFARAVVETFNNDQLAAWHLSSCVWETMELFYCDVKRRDHERSVRLFFDRSTFDERWPALALLGQRTDLNWDGINYIDLRQQDPVLGWMTDGPQGRRQ